LNQNVTPNQVCDIVLKGGITSGVVYPLALTSLAQHYRFSNIGGTSAGAIAAAAAAAAEYGRQTGHSGFARLAKIPDEIGPNLLGLFQPTPALKPAYDIFIAALKAKTKLEMMGAVSLAAIKGYWGSALAGVAPGLAIIVLALAFGGGGGWVLFGLLAVLVGLALAIGWCLSTAVGSEPASNDFGLCPGIRQPHFQSEAFTDWLARLIDEAAGRGKDTDRPLTFGELAALPGDKAIQLAMMTTSLMEQRPYTLPMEARHSLPTNHLPFVFERSEWSKLFPQRIMTFLTNQCDRFEPAAGDKGEFYYFPDAVRLPLVVAARMSLSFPGLICAVPLWRRDFTLSTETERNKLRRCLFSDGGLSSNFPIHFFDHLLPNQPTFAISLDEFDDKRNRENKRVWLPLAAGGGSQLPIRPFEGLAAFVMRLLDSAKNWQDNLQSVLPGYRERIAHVVLKSDEGGLNLTMDEAKIKKLAGYGKEAGETLCTEFDLNAHRWRRFLVALARMEETLDELAAAYEGVPGGPENFADFLARYPQEARYYDQSPAVLAAMLARGSELAECGKSWRSRPTIREGHIPSPPTNLRISPKP
jgi:predicted acylesterase/phospholipase RssA